MNVKRYPAAAAAAGVMAVMVFLVAPVGSQLTRPADDEARTTTTTRQIAQPGEFIELATRACGLKAVYAKGAGYVETSEELEKPLPPEMKRMAFEVWVVPPLAKTAMPAPQQVRVSDGKCVYTLIRGPKATLYGRKRRITPTNFYNALDMAAAYCDAASGYENLTRAVKFMPVAAPAKFIKKYPDLRWFQLQPVVEPAHHLVAGSEWVKMGLDPKDGLARVIVGVKLKHVEKAEDQAESTIRVEVAVVFEEVRHGEIKQADLKLPADAAQAEWIDADTGKPMPPPTELIVVEEPEP